MSIKKLGRYDLLRVLGKGAMGLVYEGRDPNLDRRVAIKTIKVENLSDEAAAEYEVRFRTEARSAARLQHPHIVSVYDSDRDGDIAYLVMELIQGDDLKHHMDLGDRFTLQETLRIVVDLLSALDYAHRQNIVHRDIKPANLLIEPSGRVKLTDFGVARIQDSGDATRTRGTMVGTLKYMSPEQVQGLAIDSRADLFATGVVLYQLLTGQRPFDGDSDFAVIQQIVAHDPAPVSSINPSLPQAMDAVLARALAKQREQRFANGLEFAAALQAAAGQAADPTVVAPPSDRAIARSSTWTGTVRAGESLVDTHGGTSGSIVTQELELVYWKDVKDSSDVEDLRGFLARFPAGIYSDLARRRLRKLGVRLPDDASAASLSGTRKLDDKTLRMASDRSEDATPPPLARSAAQSHRAPVPGVDSAAPRSAALPAATTGPAAVASAESPAKAADAAPDAHVDASVAAPALPPGQVANGEGQAEGARPSGSDGAAMPKSDASLLHVTDVARRAQAAMAMHTSTEPTPRGDAAADPISDSISDPISDSVTDHAASAATGTGTGTAAASGAGTGHGLQPSTAYGAAADAARTSDSALAAEAASVAARESMPRPEPHAVVDSPVARHRPLVWLLAGVVVLAGAGLWWKQASGPAQPASDAASALSALPASAAAPTSGVAAQVPDADASATRSDAAAAASTSPALVAPSASAATGGAAAGNLAARAPAHAGSAATPARATAAKASRTASGLADAPAEKSRDASAPRPPAPRTADASAAPPTARQRAEAATARASGSATNPREVCGGKSFFSLQSCLSEQCAKPAFAGASECIELKAIEKRQRDVDQNRK